MRFFLAKKFDRGVTLFELLIVAIMAGVLAIISTPTILGLVSFNKVKSAQQQVQGILRDAQSQAIRQGRPCEITINNTDNPITLSSYDTINKTACSTYSSLELPKNIKIATTLSGTPPKVSFNYKGQTNKGGTLVFYSANDSSGDLFGKQNGNAKGKRCLVISLYLGMMRTGDYADPKDLINYGNSPDENSCNTSAANL